MPETRIQAGASHRLDEFYRAILEKLGEDKAAQYVTGLFAAIDRIAAHGVVSQPIPAASGVNGFFFRYEGYFVYWRNLSNGDIGIVTLLHQRKHQLSRFQDDFGSF